MSAKNLNNKIIIMNVIYNEIIQTCVKEDCLYFHEVTEVVDPNFMAPVGAKKITAKARLVLLIG